MNRGSFVTADGCRLTYHSEGEGRPVLWQHGLGATVDQPAAVFPQQAGLRRITMMCRGHEDSDLGELSGISIANFAEDAIALLDHLGIEKADVGGISLGAGISLRLAVLHPDRVSRLVLARPAWVDRAGPETQMAYVAAGEYLKRYGGEEGLALFRETDTYKDLKAKSEDNAKSLLGYFSRPRPETTTALLARIPKDGPGITRREMAEITAPTLVIGNGEDYVHPLGYAQELASLIPGARLKVITSKNTSVALYTSEFSEALSSFLAGGRQ